MYRPYGLTKTLKLAVFPKNLKVNAKIIQIYVSLLCSVVLPPAFRNAGPPVPFTGIAPSNSHPVC